jgi:hypothetical protein
MTTTKELTPEQRLTVVKHLATGKAPDVVATITRLDRSTVVDIGSHHGYPHPEKLKRAAEILQNNLDTQRTALPQGTPDTSVRVTRPAASSPSSVTTPDARPTSGPDEIRILLNTAKAHPSKRIQKAADKVFDDLDRLRALIREDEEKNAERRKAEAQKAAARAEVKRLEEQLAAAKAKLRGTTPPAAAATDSGGPTAAEIRLWAADNNVPCPNTGRVPAAVREQYDQAHAA